MATFSLTQVYLEPAQKKALQQRAKAHGTKVAEEIRAAVTAYLQGVTPEELELLDSATREAEKHLKDMAEQLVAVNRKAQTVFDEMARLRGGYPEGWE